MKKIFSLVSLVALMLAETMTVSAQDTVEATVGTDVVSQYVWRGYDLGGVSVQPTLGVSYKGLSLSGWGSVGLSNPDDTREFDLTLAYETCGFNFGITDYWFNAGLDPENRYFAYGAHSTNHVFEANVGYDFGFASLQWYTNFAGNDGVTGAGKRAYSSYVEASVPFALGGIDWTAAAGFVPFATDFYGVDNFAFVNLALTAAAEIKVTDTFSIPVFGQVAFNPCTRNAFFVVGITLQP